MSIDDRSSPPRRPQSGTHPAAAVPAAPDSGPGLRFARRPKVGQDCPQRIDAERDGAAILDAWLRRTGTSRDAYGERSGRSGTYVGKMIATEVAWPVDSILALPDHHAESLLDELRDFVRARARARRAG